MPVAGHFCQADIVFTNLATASSADAASPAKVPLSGSTLSRTIESLSANFDDRFEHVFGLRAKMALNGWLNSHLALAKRALSSMIGGIGFFISTC